MGIGTRTTYMKLQRFIRRRGGEKVPAMRNAITAKSPKGKIGQIQVRRYTGVTKNSASKLVDTFVERNGGKEQVLAILQASEHEGIQRLLEAAEERKQYSIPRLIVEAKIKPETLILEFSRAAVRMGQLETAAQAAVAMPQVVRELVRHALPKSEICDLCFGQGKVPAQVNHNEGKKTCSKCHGEGTLLTNHPGQYKAVKELKELAGLKQQAAPLIQVNKTTNNQAMLVGGANLVENVLQMGDRIMHSLPPPTPALPPAGDTVEAEVV